jgi:hypothetical protein
MVKKNCNKCGVERESDDFTKDCTKKDGLRTICKICSKEKYRQNRDNEILRVKNYQKNNREQVLKQKLIHSKKYFIKNHDKIKEYQKNYKSNRRKTDSLFKLSNGLRSRLYGFLKKRHINKNNTTFEIVGCTPQELKKHLEQTFTGTMSWDNYGEWHIDHKTPLASANNEEELYKLCHFTNLQSMWATDNIKKGSKII